jgi:hypothetical protein
LTNRRVIARAAQDVDSGIDQQTITQAVP